MKRMRGREATITGLACLALAVCGAGQWSLAGEAPSSQKAAQEAAEKAAQFLQSQANEDGSFGKGPVGRMPGFVGLAMYALATTGGKPDLKKYPSIEKSAALLVKTQQGNGSIAIPEFANENYNTSIAILALKSLNDPKYQEVLEKAKKYVLSCQLTEKDGYDKDKHNRSYGAFGYGDSRQADLSNTSFSLDALKALGVPEDSPAYKNAIIFIKRCQDSAENDVPEMQGGPGKGGFTYMPGEGRMGNIKNNRGKEIPKPYGSMTYSAVKSLIYCGMKQDSPELQAAAQWIKDNYTVKENPGGIGTQGYYYYVVSMAKAFTATGIKELELPDGRKAHWYEDLGAHLASLKQANGAFMNPDKRWMEDDPLLSTSYALIALNLCLEAFPKQ